MVPLCSNTNEQRTSSRTVQCTKYDEFEGRKEQFVLNRIEKVFFCLILMV
jgi:hypothetical protein